CGTRHIGVLRAFLYFMTPRPLQSTVFPYTTLFRSILLALNHIRKNEEYTIGSLIKKAFTRFWAMLGSNILFGLIAFGFLFVSLIDRKSTRLNSSHVKISYAVFCLKKKDGDTHERSD